MKIMKIIKFHARIQKKKKRDNHYEKNRIPIDNNGNLENIVITNENYENHENHAIQRENH